MADFTIADKQVGGAEGRKLTYDPDDAGEETYCGVSRKFNPDWRGWSIIDLYRGNPEFPHCLAHLPDLQLAVKEIFKEKYWDTFHGDRIPHQGLANNLYDIAVNIEQATAIIWLQIALTVMNRNDPEKFYPDLKLDGKMNPYGATMQALFKFVQVEKYNQSRVDDDPYDTINHMLNDRQSVHYQDRQYQNPVQRKYTRGHLKRTRYDD